jgi:hypothetical protein
MCRRRRHPMPMHRQRDTSDNYRGINRVEYEYVYTLDRGVRSESGAPSRHSAPRRSPCLARTPPAAP